MWKLEMISHLLLTSMSPRHQPQLLQGLHIQLPRQLLQGLHLKLPRQLHQVLL